MKRSLDKFLSHEEGDEDQVSMSRGANPEDELVERMEESDRQIANALINKYDGERVDRESEEIKRRYLISYMKKVIEKLPLSQEIIDASKAVEGDDEFLKMYSIAKTCVHSEMQLKKLLAFNSAFDMFTNVFGRAFHDRLVAPNLTNIIPHDKLDAAYEVFRETLSSDDSDMSTELHCVAFLIQNEIEKRQSLKIPNPIFRRLTQQMKAMCQYVTVLFSHLASKPITPPSRSNSTDAEREIKTEEGYDDSDIEIIDPISVTDER